MVELQIVILAVAGSSPVGHPTFLAAAKSACRATLAPMLRRVSFFLLCFAALPFGAVADWHVEKRERLPAPGAVEFSRLVAKSPSASVRLHVVTFSAKSHTLALMDDPQNAFDLATASRKRGAVAAVNGGYFRPDRTPLGLRIRQGREIHPLERAALLSGIIVVRDSRVALLRLREFNPAPPPAEALQAGPFLVDGGKPVAGLDAARADARTAVFTDGASRWGVISTDALTLADLGAILAQAEIVPGGKITRALNLDGGSSSGLWVAGAPPFYRRELRDVRDFLAIVPR